MGFSSIQKTASTGSSATGALVGANSLQPASISPIQVGGTAVWAWWCSGIWNALCWGYYQCWAVLDFYAEPLDPVCKKIEPGAGSGLKKKKILVMVLKIRLGSSLALRNPDQTYFYSFFSKTPIPDSRSGPILKKTRPGFGLVFTNCHWKQWFKLVKPSACPTLVITNGGSMQGGRCDSMLAGSYFSREPSVSVPTFFKVCKNHQFQFNWLISIYFL